MTFSTERHAKAEMGLVSKFKRFSGVVSAIFVSVVLTFAIEYRDSIDESLLVFLYCITIGIAIALACLSLKPPFLATEAYFREKDLSVRLSEARFENTKLIEELEITEKCLEIRTIWSASLNSLEKSPIKETIIECVDPLLEIIFMAPECTIHSEWTCSIYRPKRVNNQDSDKTLSCFWRLTSPHHPNPNKGRDIPINRGHIGVTFERGRPFLHYDGDSNAHQGFQFDPDDQKSGDDKRYVTFLSIPAMDKTTDRCFAVFTITFNHSISLHPKAESTLKSFSNVLLEILNRKKQYKSIH